MTTGTPLHIAIKNMPVVINVLLQIEGLGKCVNKILHITYEEAIHCDTQEIGLRHYVINSY